MDSIDTLFNTIDSTKITTTQDSDKICDTESVTDKELVNDKSIIKCNVNTLNSYHIKIKSISESELQGLSKNQRKKILKKIHWNSIKLEKRKEEKRRKKEKRNENIRNNIPVGPSRKQFQYHKMVDSKCKLKVAIDCSFEEYMTDKGIAHVVQQLQYCYSANRRAESSIQLYFTGVNGRLHDRFQSIGDVRGWDINYEQRDYSELFEADRIVYLTSESEHELTDLDERDTYIIGGLIDYNHHKGLCHKLANEKNIRHARLPIGKYLNLYTRHVLTINHVFEILLKYTANKDWCKSLSEVIPQRKAPQIKDLEEEEVKEKKEEEPGVQSDGGVTPAPPIHDESPHCEGDLHITDEEKTVVETES